MNHKKYTEMNGFIKNVDFRMADLRDDYSVFTIAVLDNNVKYLYNNNHTRSIIYRLVNKYMQYKRITFTNYRDYPPSLFKK